jgi:hypothetical protein
MIGAHRPTARKQFRYGKSRPAKAASRPISLTKLGASQRSAHRSTGRRPGLSVSVRAHPNRQRDGRQEAKSIRYLTRSRSSMPGTFEPLSSGN